MSHDELCKMLSERAEQHEALGYRVLFALTDEDDILWDGTGSTAIIGAHDDDEVDTTLTMKRADFEGLISGELDPTMAFMMGKLKVSGTMGVAMKLSSMLGDA